MVSAGSCAEPTFIPAAVADRRKCAGFSGVRGGMGVAVRACQGVTMQARRQIDPNGDGRTERSLFDGLLRGYRFTVCEDVSAAVRALDVRRRVYVDLCGYDLAVPDGYDSRSWLLVAEDVDSGQPIGSMRVTPRTHGPLELEEYLRLPDQLAQHALVEVTRFAVLPDHRDSRRFLPPVALGLYKLVSQLVRRLGADYVVICAKPERSWSYRWLGFEPTGLSTRYGKLGATEHDLLTCDLRRDMLALRRHRYWDFVFRMDHPEVVMPRNLPALGLATQWPTSAIRRTA